MNLKTLSLGLFLTFALSLGLGRYFDTRCENGCLQTIAEKSHGNFHFRFDDDDAGGDDDVDFGSKSEDPVTLPFGKIEHLEELEVNLVQTELEIMKGPALMVRAQGIVSDKKWKIDTSDRKLAIDMRDKGPDSLHLELPADFKGRIKITTVSGEIVLGPELTMDELSLNSASGDIRLSSWPAKELSVNTVSGDFKSDVAPKIVTKEITIRGVSADFNFEANSGFEDLKIQTVSGDVALKINGKADFDYRLHSISGDFKGIPGGVLQEAIANKEMKGTVGETKKSSLEFESISGDFTLTL